jgi:hypothetical protein
MNNFTKNLTAQLKAHGIALEQIKPAGKTAITTAYLTPEECSTVAGGLEPGTSNFWRGDDFCKNV